MAPMVVAGGGGEGMDGGDTNRSVRNVFDGAVRSDLMP